MADFIKLRNHTIIVAALVIATWYLCAISIEKLVGLYEPVAHSVESSWRAQARMDLQDIKAQMLRSIEKKELNMGKMKSVYDWSLDRLSKRRVGGTTSDYIVVQMPTTQVAWDRRILTRDKLGGIDVVSFSEWQYHIFKELFKFYDTTENLNNRWVDPETNDPELLEWIFVPNPDMTVSATLEQSFKCVVVIARIKGSEIQKPFTDLKNKHEQLIIFLTALSIMSFITGLTYIINMLYRIEGNRTPKGG